LPLTGFSASDLCPLSAPAGFDRGLAIFANRGRQRLLRGLDSFFCGLGGVFRLLIGFLCCLPLQFGCTRCALCLGGPPLRMPRRLKKCPPLVRVHSARTSSMSTGIGGALE
jgi:hypothetical protein